MALHQHKKVPHAEFGLRDALNVAAPVASILFPPAAPFIAAGTALADPLLVQAEQKKAAEEADQLAQLTAFSQTQSNKFGNTNVPDPASSDIPVFQDGGDLSNVLGFNPSQGDTDKATAVANGAIEVEKNEFILKRTPTGRFIEGEDFKDKLTHADGGHLFTPGPDDIIVPAADRKKVKEWIKNKDFQSIDAYRLSLPKSGAVQARFGMINSSNSHSSRNFKAQTGLNLADPDEQNVFNEANLDPSGSFFDQQIGENPELVAQQPELIQETSANQAFANAPTTISPAGGFDKRPSNVDLSRIGTGVTKALSLAPAIGNIIEGVTSTAKTTDPVKNLRSQEAIDILKSITLDIEPGLRDVDISAAAAEQKASRLAPGNAGVLLSQQGTIRAETLRQKGRLRSEKSNVESLAKRDVASATSLAGREDAAAIKFAQESTEAAQARKRDFTRTGISQVSEFIQREERDKNRRLSEEEKMKIILATFPDLAEVLKTT